MEKGNHVQHNIEIDPHRYVQHKSDVKETCIDSKFNIAWRQDVTSHDSCSKSSRSSWSIHCKLLRPWEVRLGIERNPSCTCKTWAKSEGEIKVIPQKLSFKLGGESWRIAAARAFETTSSVISLTRSACAKLQVYAIARALQQNSKLNWKTNK